MTVVIALFSGAAGAFAVAFSTGKRMGEMLTEIRELRAMVIYMRDKLDRHLEKGD